MCLPNFPCLEPVQLHEKFSNSQNNLFVPAGSCCHCHRALSSVMAAVRPEAALNASSSWILLDTLFCNVFTKSFHWLLLLIPLPHSTPFSTQCETMITTTILLKLNKITTQQIFLPPPMIHLLPLAHLKPSRKALAAAGGLKPKSSYCWIMSKKIAL